MGHGFKRGRDYDMSSYGRASKRARTSASSRKIVAARRSTRAPLNPRTGGYLGLELKFLDTSVVNSGLTITSSGAGLE